MKKAGVLLAISSLPSSFGIGDLGCNAFKFIDILTTMNVKIWQVLPITPLGYGNSPYQSSSSFAGDEIYIGIDKLVDDGLLYSDDVKNFNQELSYVEYEAVREYKSQLFKKAFANFLNLKETNFKDEYAQFLDNNLWVTNYALFQTFKQLNDGDMWTDWQSKHKNWFDDNDFDISEYQDSVDYHIFLQFVFHRQWVSLREYANKNSIGIMGDLPIYAGLDSVDVWQNPVMFLLDDDKKPTFVAGVPPDYFSETGQLWGNPLYDWDNLKKDDYKFWIERLKGNFKMFDILRIDHFRAFDTYWKIPAKSATAINGEWIEAPGYDFFDAVYKAIPDANIIAEDLGDLRDEVFELRDHYNLKGMKVFPFHFDARSKDNDKFSSIENIIVYTGTHDNDTLFEWYELQNSWIKKQLKKFFHANESNIISKIIKYSLSTSAVDVIVPVQDILRLDNDARINTPGQVGSPNWEWKLVDFEALNQATNSFADKVSKSGRCK